MAVMDQFGDPVGLHGHPVLVVLDLFGHADDKSRHGGTPWGDGSDGVTR
jgi:hypothetical protein